MPREFTYDILQEFDTISSNESSTGNVYTKEVNLIAYGDGDGVYDIRNWTLLKSGERRMGKGITLSLDEMDDLAD